MAQEEVKAPTISEIIAGMDPNDVDEFIDNLSEQDLRRFLEESEAANRPTQFIEIDRDLAVAEMPEMAAAYDDGARLFSSEDGFEFISIPIKNQERPFESLDVHFSKVGFPSAIDGWNMPDAVRSAFKDLKDFSQENLSDILLSVVSKMRRNEITGDDKFGPMPRTPFSKTFLRLKSEGLIFDQSVDVSEDGQRFRIGRDTYQNLIDATSGEQRRALNRFFGTTLDDNIRAALALDTGGMEGLFSYMESFAPSIGGSHHDVDVPLEFVWATDSEKQRGVRDRDARLEAERIESERIQAALRGRPPDAPLGGSPVGQAFKFINDWVAEPIVDKVRTAMSWAQANKEFSPLDIKASLNDNFFEQLELLEKKIGVYHQLLPGEEDILADLPDDTRMQVEAALSGRDGSKALKILLATDWSAYKATIEALSREARRLEDMGSFQRAIAGLFNHVGNFYAAVSNGDRLVPETAKDIFGAAGSVFGGVVNAMSTARVEMGLDGGFLIIPEAIRMDRNKVMKEIRGIDAKIINLSGRYLDEINQGKWTSIGPGASEEEKMAAAMNAARGAVLDNSEMHAMDGSSMSTAMRRWGLSQIESGIYGFRGQPKEDDSVVKKIWFDFLAGMSMGHSTLDVESHYIDKYERTIASDEGLFDLLGIKEINNALIAGEFLMEDLPGVVAGRVQAARNVLALKKQIYAEDRALYYELAHDPISAFLATKWSIAGIKGAGRTANVVASMGASAPGFFWDLAKTRLKGAGFKIARGKTVAQKLKEADVKALPSKAVEVPETAKKLTTIEKFQAIMGRVREEAMLSAAEADLVEEIGNKIVGHTPRKMVNTRHGTKVISHGEFHAIKNLVQKLEIDAAKGHVVPPRTSGGVNFTDNVINMLASIAAMSSEEIMAFQRARKLGGGPRKTPLELARDIREWWKKKDLGEFIHSLYDNVVGEEIVGRVVENVTDIRSHRNKVRRSKGANVSALRTKVSAMLHSVASEAMMVVKHRRADRVRRVFEGIKEGFKNRHVVSPRNQIMEASDFNRARARYDTKLRAIERVEKAKPALKTAAQNLKSARKEFVARAKGKPSTSSTFGRFTDSTLNDIMLGLGSEIMRLRGLIKRETRKFLPEGSRDVISKKVERLNRIEDDFRRNKPIPEHDIEFVGSVRWERAKIDMDKKASAFARTRIREAIKKDSKSRALAREQDDILATAKSIHNRMGKKPFRQTVDSALKKGKVPVFLTKAELRKLDPRRHSKELGKASEDLPPELSSRIAKSADELWDEITDAYNMEIAAETRLSKPWSKMADDIQRGEAARLSALRREGREIPQFAASDTFAEQGAKIASWMQNNAEALIEGALKSFDRIIDLGFDAARPIVNLIGESRLARNHLDRAYRSRTFYENYYRYQMAINGVNMLRQSLFQMLDDLELNPVAARWYMEGGITAKGDRLVGPRQKMALQEATRIFEDVWTDLINSGLVVPRRDNIGFLGRYYPHEISVPRRGQSGTVGGLPRSPKFPKEKSLLRREGGTPTIASPETRELDMRRFIADRVLQGSQQARARALVPYLTLDDFPVTSPKSKKSFLDPRGREFRSKTIVEDPASVVPEKIEEQLVNLAKYNFYWGLLEDPSMVAWGNKTFHIFEDGSRGIPMLQAEGLNTGVFRNLQTRIGRKHGANTAFLHPHLRDLLQEAERGASPLQATRGMRFMHEMTSWIKANLVTQSISTTAMNLVGNFFYLDSQGLAPWTKRGFDAWKRAIRVLRGKTPEDRRLRMALQREGVIGASIQRNLISSMDKAFQGKSESFWQILSKGLVNHRDSFLREGFGNFYKFIDDVGRTAGAIGKLDQGVPLRGIGLAVDFFMPNYAKAISPFKRLVTFLEKHVPAGNMFLMFPAENIRVASNILRTKPQAFARWMAYTLVPTWLNGLFYGRSPDQQVMELSFTDPAINPWEKLQNALSRWQSPFWFRDPTTGEANFAMVDFLNTTPIGNMLGHFGQRGTITGGRREPGVFNQTMQVMGHFREMFLDFNNPGTAAGLVAENVNPITGRDLVDEDLPRSFILAKKLGYYVGQFGVPRFLRGGLAPVGGSVVSFLTGDPRAGRLFQESMDPLRVRQHMAKTGGRSPWEGLVPSVSQVALRRYTGVRWQAASSEQKLTQLVSLFKAAAYLSKGSGELQLEKLDGLLEFFEDNGEESALKHFVEEMNMTEEQARDVLVKLDRPGIENWFVGMDAGPYQFFFIELAKRMGVSPSWIARLEQHYLVSRWDRLIQGDAETRFNQIVRGSMRARGFNNKAEAIQFLMNEFPEEAKELQDKYADYEPRIAELIDDITGAISLHGDLKRRVDEALEAGSVSDIFKFSIEDRREAAIKREDLKSKQREPRKLDR